MGDYRMSTVKTQSEKTKYYFGSLEKIVDSAEDSSEFVETYRDYTRHLDLARRERKQHFENTAKRLVNCSVLNALLGTASSFNPNENPIFTVISYYAFGTAVIAAFSAPLIYYLSILDDKWDFNRIANAKEVTWQHAVRSSERLLRRQITSYNSLKKRFMR